MRSFFPLITLSIACQQPPEYLETILPQMELSTTNLDFGEIDWGTNNTKSFYIENQGELPMGLHELKLSEEGFESNFSILYSPQTIECPQEQGADDTEYLLSSDANKEKLLNALSVPKQQYHRYTNIHVLEDELRD